MSGKKNEVIEEETQSVGRVVWDYVKTLAIVAAVILLLQFFVIINAKIPSGSMENTIMEGERLFGNRLAYVFSDPQRYDIVIFKYPDDESQLFIKRVIGLPGETVIITGGKVYVVDEYTKTDDISDESLIADPMQLSGTTMLDDSFIKEPMNTSEACVFRVPEGSYFMLGDNRNNSRDSRYWDNPFVEKDKILGEAGLRYWPLNKISLVGYSGDQS